MKRPLLAATCVVLPLAVTLPAAHAEPFAPLGTATTVLNTIAGLTLDTASTAFQTGSTGSRVFAGHQRAVFSNEAPAQPAHDSVLTASSIGGLLPMGAHTDVGLMVTRFDQESDFATPADTLQNEGNSVTALVRHDYKGLTIDAMAGSSRPGMTATLDGTGTMVSAEERVSFVRLQGAYEFSDQAWRYGPFAGIDVADLLLARHVDATLSLDHDRERFVQQRMGAHLAHDTQVGGWHLVPDIRLRWNHTPERNAGTATGALITGGDLRPLAQQRESVWQTFDAQVTVTAPGGTSVWLTAQQDVGTGTTEHYTVSAGLQQAF